jgi:hypothetical protein
MPNYDTFKEIIDLNAWQDTAYHLLPIAADHLLQPQLARAGEEENEDEDERDDEGEEEEDDDDLPQYRKYASLPRRSHDVFEAEEDEEDDEEGEEEEDEEEEDNESLLRRQNRKQQLKQKRKVCSFQQALEQMHQNNGKVTSAVNKEFLLSGNNRKSSFGVYSDTLTDERVLGTFDPDKLPFDPDIPHKKEAAHYDMNFFRRQLRRGVVLCSAPLHDPTKVKKKHLPPSSVTAADMNSSNPGKYLMAHAIHGRGDAMAHIHVGGGLNHCHAEGMIFDINANPVTARPIQAINSLLGGQKNFQLSNCCNWWNTRATTGIVNLYNAGQLEEVPPQPLRSLSCYQSAHFNVQSVPTPGEVIFWLNGERYSLQVADPCADYGMIDSGIPFIRGLQNVPAIMPPNWLNNQFLQTRPHIVDAFCHPHYGNWFDGRRLEYQHIVLGYGNAVGLNVRTAYTNDAMRAYRLAFRNTVPLDQKVEPGQFHYSHICPFTCMYNAAYKYGRDEYYSPHRVQAMLDPWKMEEGFGQGTVLHLLHNRNVVQSLWTPMDASGIHHGYVKMRLPCPMHTSYHVVYGPWQHPFSRARYIRYFRYYRPDPCPKMFWFEFN